MTSSLDERILAALSGKSVGRGVRDFESDPSAISKANKAVEILLGEGFSPSGAAFLSVGGADGTELEHVLKSTSARHGLLLEFDHRLAALATEKALRLQAARGACMVVFPGDALRNLDDAIASLDEWRDAGAIRSIVLTMHAVLHEFPNRGGGTTDLEGFLQKVLWRRLPVLAIAREPCMPDGMPAHVYLSANCRPDILANLAMRIRGAHSEFLAGAAPAPMAKSVRMNSRLAIETIAKLFYLESLAYEIDERITSFSKKELVSAFRNVFGNENVRTETFQSNSVDGFWKSLGISLHDEDGRELNKPEFHVRIVAKWYPPEAVSKMDTTKRTVLEDDGKVLAPGSVPERLPDADSDSNRSYRKLENADSQLGIGGLVSVVRPAGGRPPIDLWTPGPTRSEFLDHYSTIVGYETAEKLWSLSQAAISAVANGDFERHVDIGKELLRVSPGNPYLMAEGAYFVGEGLRLLADVEQDEAMRINLRNQAMQSYQLSVEALPQDPRPLRGMGRILEVQGRYEEALRNLKHAKGLCLTGLLSHKEATLRPDLAHEMLRTTRHLIHCLLEIRETNPQSQWNRENRRQELEGLLAECDNYHREYMPIFDRAESWSGIEWFMGLVFLGRAWAKLGHPEKAKPYLAFALDRRRSLLTVDAKLSAVERANLRWWIAVASDRTMTFDSHSRELLDRLANAVNLGESRAVLQVIDDFLLPSMPPWGHGI